MHALTTSISTLLLLCVPLATLMGLAPTALRHARAPRLTSLLTALALRSGVRCCGQLSRLSSRLSLPLPSRARCHEAAAYAKLLSSPPEPGASPPPARRRPPRRLPRPR